MSNKIKYILPVILGVSCLTSCNNETTYTVKLYDYSASSNYTTYELTSSTKVVEGKTFSYPSKPSRKTFYKFVGWTSDEEHTKFFDFNAPITSDVTLYANYAKQNQRVVYVDYDDGVSRWGIKDKGSTIEIAKIPTDPAEEKWKFIGWYLNKGYTEKLPDATTTIKIEEDDIYLYAYYDYRTYPVKYHFNGGKFPFITNTKYIKWGEYAEDFVPPSEGGQTFLGWYTEKELTNKFDFSTQIKQAWNLWGKWETTSTI